MRQRQDSHPSANALRAAQKYYETVSMRGLIGFGIMSEQSSNNNAGQPAPGPLPKAGRKSLLRSGQLTLARTRRAAKRAKAQTGALAGPAISKTATGLRRGGQHGWGALKTFSKNKARPRLNRAGRWFAGLLKPASLMRGYRRLLLLIHRRGPDRAIERACFVQTSKHIPLSIVRVPHQLRRSGHDYRPTPRLVFKWAMAALPEPMNRFEFVDVGSGQGRVLLMASRYPFEKITGVEIAEELHNDALLNVAQYPRTLMKCRDINPLHLSAMRLEIPNQDTVFFLNNPFQRSMLERVVGHIVQSYKHQPRRFYVICVDCRDEQIFEDTGIFQKVQIPWKQRVRIKGFSPYSIALYRTVR